MHFKHPELLYALFLLVIPILVHLFQLRRFRTEKFTNVKFLKKVALQTRKSSKLKKWLILATRLIALAAIIIAFAQPYFPPSSGQIVSRETVIYLDNSYSMQARGQDGILLKRSVQELLETLPQEGRVSFFTNQEDYPEIQVSSLRKKLQELDYSAEQLEWSTIKLKAEGMFSENPETRKDLIVISDFQQISNPVSLGSINLFPVLLKPEDLTNIAIDSAFISNKNLDEIRLNVRLSATGEPVKEVSLGVYDGKELLAKKMAVLDDEFRAEVEFDLPERAVEEGLLEISDPALTFDNKLYFNINESPPVDVVVIGDPEVDFLKRIYRTPDFELTSFSEDNLDYSQLAEADLVILNQPEEIPVALSRTLEKLQQENVFIIVIPSSKADLQTYNSFFRSLQIPAFDRLVEDERLITDISYDHPVFRTVFSEKVENFQYPKVQKYYSPIGRVNPVLQYENGQAFLFEENNVFVFTAALEQANTNFKSSPLIVPTFYNIGNLALSPEKLYNVIGVAEKADMRANLEQDEILQIVSNEETFIPRQQVFQNKVSLFFEDEPKKPGHYRVLNDSAYVKTLSFNLDRKESRLENRTLETSEHIKIRKSIPGVFEEIEASTMPRVLWKWFIIFGLFFLLIEMLILKFLK